MKLAGHFVSAICVVTWSSMSLALAAAADPVEDSVYGQDDRHEVYSTSVKPALRLAAGSTGAFIRRTDLLLGATKRDHFTVLGVPLGKKHGLCPGTRFEQQLSAAICSGFLVTDRHMVTAGHCVRSASDCSRLSVVFDYLYAGKGADPTIAPKSAVYQCSRLVTRVVNSEEGIDFAIVELDRRTGRPPLPIRRQGRVRNNAGLAMIGYPNGIPAKVSLAGNVADNDPKHFFSTDLDSFAGNSGAPVFDTQNMLVEGISMRGGQEYEFDGDCFRIKPCTLETCDSEDVLRASAFAQAVEALP